MKAGTCIKYIKLGGRIKFIDPAGKIDYIDLVNKEKASTKTSSDSYILDGKEVIHILGHKPPISMEFIFPVKTFKPNPFISRITGNEAY